MTTQKLSKLDKIKNIFFGKGIFVIVMLAPMIIHLIVFWLGVQIEGMALAFTDEMGKFSLKWFVSVIDSIATGGYDATGFAANIPIAIRNTLIFFSVMICSVPLEMFVAYLINKKMLGYKLVRTMLYLPGVISGLMMAIMFQQLIMADGPLLTLLNGKWGWNIPTPLIMNKPMWVINIFDVWIGLGGDIVIWLGAMGRIPDELKEAAWLDGITPWKEFTNIYFPLIFPTFTTFITLKLVGILGASGSVLLFTEGKYGTTTLSYMMFDVVWKGQASSYNISSALGLMMTIVTIPLVVGGRLFLKKFGGEVEY